MSKLKIGHVITGLQVGGAEIMMYLLLANTDREQFEPFVLSLTPGGALVSQIEALGIPVFTLDLRSGAQLPAVILAAARLLRREKPSVLQTWMVHADFVGSFAAQVSGRIPVAWGVHYSTFDQASSRTMTRWLTKLLALASYAVPSKIICCSQCSQRMRIAEGYDPSKTLFIPNGFDLETFAPSEDARSQVRHQLGLDPETPLILHAANDTPSKDHRNLFRAARHLKEKIPDARVLACGDGITGDNAKLCGWIEEECVGDVVMLLGRRNDMPTLMAAADVYTSSSYNEAFPMVIGEAMACGVPCVVTDVGDSAYIVGDTGRIAPARIAKGLAQGWIELLRMERKQRRELGCRARKRIEENFDIKAIATRYADIHRSIARGSRQAYLR